MDRGAHLAGILLQVSPHLGAKPKKLPQGAYVFSKSVFCHVEPKKAFLLLGNFTNCLFALYGEPRSSCWRRGAHHRRKDQLEMRVHSAGASLLGSPCLGAQRKGLPKGANMVSKSPPFLHGGPRCSCLRATVQNRPFCFLGCSRLLATGGEPITTLPG